MLSLFQVKFHDVFEEAPALKSLELIWLCSQECYTCFNDCCYKLLTFFLAPFIAIWWGCGFALTAFEHVWCLTPINKNVYICCGTCFKGCFKYLFDCLVTPCTRACGGIFVVFHTDRPPTPRIRPKARQTKTASRDQKGEEENQDDDDDKNRKAAILAVPIVARESSYLSHNKGNALKSIQRQMGLYN